MKFSLIISDGSHPCSTAPLQGPAEVCFEKAAKLQVQGVQLTLDSPARYPLELIQSLMEKTGLAVSGLATGEIYTRWGCSIGSGNEKTRRKAVASLQELLFYGKELGAPPLIIGAVRGRLSDAPSAPHYYHQFEESIRELLETASKVHIPLILEANDHEETDVFCDVAETYAFTQKIGSPWLSMYLDTMHLWNEKADLVGMIEQFGNKVPQIDLSGPQRTAPGPASAIDFRALMASLRHLSFAGWLTLEMRPVAQLDEVLRFLRDEGM